MTAISVTRALAEVKSLNDRIERATRQAFVATTIGGKIPGGQTKEQTEVAVKANLQSVDDLVARRKALKAAIVKSNSTATVEINGVTMTVAEAIERKGSIQLEINLANALRTQFAQARAKVEQGNVQVQARLDQMILAAVGKDRKATQEEIDGISAPFKAGNEYALLDPNGIEAQLQRRDDEIAAFVLNVDYALSEANARTTIDV